MSPQKFNVGIQNNTDSTATVTFQRQTDPDYAPIVTVERRNSAELRIEHSGAYTIRVTFTKPDATGFEQPDCPIDVDKMLGVVLDTGGIRFG